MSDRGEVTRQRILSVACEELAQKGPHAIHVHDLIDRMGVTQAMVNYYFGSRWGLIEAAVLESYKEYVDAMISVLEKNLDPVEKIVAWSMAQLEWTAQHPGISVVLNYPNLVPEVNFHSGEIYSAIQVVGLRHLDKVVEVVLDAMSKKSGQRLDPGKVRVRTATYMWTVLGVSTWNAGQHAPTGKLYNVPKSLLSAQLSDLAENWLFDKEFMLSAVQNSTVES
jgi:AcrR family transcriptional regulator